MTSSVNFSVNAEVARLKRLTWAALEREALNVGITVTAICEAASRDELRHSILTRRAAAHGIDLPTPQRQEAPAT